MLRSKRLGHGWNPVATAHGLTYSSSRDGGTEGFAPGAGGAVLHSPAEFEVAILSINLASDALCKLVAIIEKSPL